HTDCPLTDFGGKTSIFSHPVYLFLRKFSLQDSRGGSDGIGPDYHMLIEETSQPGNIKLTGMVQDAQQNKLVVHPYTVRSDKLPEYTPDVNQLYDALYNKAGVNGLFTDFPDKAVKFLNKE
ncbi:glycerophosphodiester phosphodiesterase family protein, partial [Escherichia coli]|uniref:glycerophosphodiester phosphodiesterase family protein n=1 Tax=Escherichia coli TaxID=562 RepID=UPI003F772427